MEMMTSKRAVATAKTLLEGIRANIGVISMLMESILSNLNDRLVW